MEDEPGSRKIMTAAGFGPPVVRSRFDWYRRELPNFLRKNKGLLARRDAWSLMARLLGSRLRFRSQAADTPVLFVATHHKVMTTYFTAVLRLLGAGVNLPYQKVHVEQPAPTSRLVLSMHGKLDLPALGAYRGVHVMRDPRDMIVSGYHYHKWTHEAWVHRPDDNGQTYQQKLNEADKYHGLFLEIDHFIFFYRDTLMHWNIADPDVLEVAYGDLMGPDRDQLYHMIFEHLGFEGRQLALGVDLMRLFEAKNRTGRRKGEVSAKSHLRSGKSGQWRDELEDDHLAYIERELGPVLRKFGY
ncbi:sulfotransferase domain-containing protein [Aliiroseovarius subalbicans]|uniref:sulfotransferase domain-containing protein n=1 Tax=Aliiroseovarius subalbicans TaxID=2925840 RepID=UPI001F5AD39D|nr:sulfotransferase domain-containing protein [Aliiroseovarius subalbicans]MCI2401144.1 sulfotransferase domain-containing protein [Aliiroseovarius subalbicans]